MKAIKKNPGQSIFVLILFTVVTTISIIELTKIIN
jgi:hypothetical protein